MMGAAHWVEEDGVVSAHASLPIGTTPAAWMLAAAISGGTPSIPQVKKKNSQKCTEAARAWAGGTYAKFPDFCAINYCDNLQFLIPPIHALA